MRQSGSGVGDLGSDGGRRRRMAPELRELPPPISWLALGEDLASYVPWVMRRYHTSDGRLIIKEERVKRRKYFLADRSNGRVVLNLFHVDDGAAEEEFGDAAEELRPAAIDGGDAGRRDPTVEEVTFKYSGVGLKPCGGFVATAPVFMPPVHT